MHGVCPSYPPQSLAEAGATITVGTWPRALKYFKQNLEAGKFNESMKLSDGRTMKIDKVRREGGKEGRCRTASVVVVVVVGCVTAALDGVSGGAWVWWSVTP